MSESSSSSWRCAAHRHGSMFTFCVVKLLFFLSRHSDEWKAACLNETSSSGGVFFMAGLWEKEKNNTNKWVGSERPGESQHRDYMNNLCVTWHEDNNAVVLITPAGGEVSITVIRTRKAAWVFVFLRWTGACWICMFGLNAGYVLSVALVGSQHSSKWHWRGIREQRWKYISEKKQSGADTTRPFILFKSLMCVSVRPMSKKGVIIVVINCGAD